MQELFKKCKKINKTSFMICAVPSVIYLTIAYFIYKKILNQDLGAVVLFASLGLLVVIFIVTGIIALKKKNKLKDIYVKDSIENNNLTLYEIEKEMNIENNLTLIDEDKNITKEERPIFYITGHIINYAYRNKLSEEKSTVRIEVSKELFEQLEENKNITFNKKNILNYRIFY